MGRSILSLLAGLAGLLLVHWPAAAQAPAAEQQKLVNSAVATIERLQTDVNFQQNMLPLLRRAKAVLIVPNLIKAGFIIGGEYGNGVLLARGPDGQWSAPAFYTLAAGSLGFQAGIQDAEVLFVIMTDKALEALLSHAVKLGADLGVAFLTAGGGMEASTTTNLGADVYAFSHAIGLYGGGALEGAVIKARPTWNKAYYGEPAAPEAVLVQRGFDNPQAQRLKEILAQ